MLFKLLLFLDRKNILDKTERALKFGNYSPQTRKAYLLYIKEYIKFSKETGIKDKDIEKITFSKVGKLSRILLVTTPTGAKSGYFELRHLSPQNLGALS